MSEPSERDRESAEWLRDRAGLPVDGNEPWIKAAIEIIATARAEERERCAKIALRSAQAQSAEEEYCCAGVAQDIASRIRSGQ